MRTLLILLCLVGVVYAAPETIATRCADDASCTVQFHEPLNADDGNPLSESGGESSYNPSDTTDGQLIKWSTSGYTMGLVDATGAGDSPDVELPGRDYVLRGDGDGSWDIYDLSGGNGAKRICQVHYEHVEGDWKSGDSPSCAADRRHKLHTYTWGGGSYQWQMTGDNNSGTCLINPYMANHGIAGFGVLYSSLGVAQEKSTWVRLETCVYTDSTDLATGADVYAAFRATRIDTGAQDTLTYGEGAQDPGEDLGALDTPMIGLYRQNSPGSEARFISTPAQLSYTTNTGQWPGPDCDIEPNATPCTPSAPMILDTAGP